MIKKNYYSALRLFIFGSLVSRTIMFLVFASLSLPALCQSTVTLRGRVIDERTNEPVIGATVKVKNTTTGTITDAKGDFQFTVKHSLPVTLVFSIVGFKYQEYDVYENEPLTVPLSEDFNKLSTVVVVGYGTQKRSDLTGSVASIQVSQLKDAAPTSFVDALQGLASGVQVTSTSGAPGATSIVRIRGGNSITGGNDPLYVVDGFPIYNDNKAADAGSATATVGTATGLNPLSSLNPGDIESIDVLKDASATSIYGSRGANGVIIITTKKGKAGKSVVSYDGSFGSQKLAHKIDLLNAQQWATYWNDAQGKTVFTQDQIDGYANNSTDWQDAAFRTASTQNHQITFSGGNDKTQFSSSLGYLGQEGVVINTDFKRYTGRISVNSKLSTKFNVGLNLNESYSTSNAATTSNITAILYMPPVLPVYDANGAYTLYNNYNTSGSGNPVAYLNSVTNQSNLQRTLGSAFGEYEIIKGLKAKVLIGADLLTNRQYNYVPKPLYESLSTGGSASIRDKFTTNWLNENTLTYTTSINNVHNIDLLGGFTQQKSETTGHVSGATGFGNDLTEYYNLATSASTPSSASSYSGWSLLSYLGRVNYNYDHKYFVTASFRADGKSVLGKNNRYGYFPSGSFGWQLDKEAFFKNIANAASISNTKIRLSYGRTGNSEIDPYQSLSLLTGNLYPNGSTSTNTGFSPITIKNENLKWETTDQYDAGIDLGFFNSRIKFTADIYYKRTHDLLISKYVPYTSGYPVSLQNIGEIENKGLELALNTENIKGKFNWNTNATFSVNRNKVLSLGGVNQIIIGGSTQVGNIIKVGQPLGAFYGLKTDGLYTAANLPTDLSTTVLGASTAVGDIKYVDISGDGKITTAADQTIIGSAQPKFIFGLTNTFNYKSFDLSVFVQGSYGNQIYSYILRQLQTPNGFNNSIAGFADHYTATNTTAQYQRANTAINNSTNSDLYVYDGSYIRLKTVTLGYTLPKKVLAKIKATNVRFYVSGQNLLTVSKYLGFDPDVNSYALDASRQGVDLGSYPTAKSITGGVNITF